MRPLSHLGEGPTSKDFDLYKRNEQLYDSLAARGEEIIEASRKTALGDYYAPPKPTLRELNKEYEHALQRKVRLEELRVPKDIIKAEEEFIVEVYTMIQNKDYAKASDPSYKSYVKERDRRETAWHNSPELNQLVTEIRQYNESEYEKLIRNDQ